MSIASRLTGLARLAARATAALAGVCLVLMMLQTVADVALTFLFNAPIEGNLEVVSHYYMVAVVFLPLALVELKHEHISVELFIMKLPPVARNRLYAVTSLVGAGFLAMLCRGTVLDALAATRLGEIVMGSALIYVWPAKWALPVGFAAMLLAVAANLAAALDDPAGYQPQPDVPETR